MRYSHLKSFQKMVLESQPASLKGPYLILCSHDYERGQLLDQLAHLVGSEVDKFRASQMNWREFWEALQAPSLFALAPVILLDEVELIPAAQIKELQPHLKEVPMILGAREKSSLNSFIEAEGVLLDLNEEKPWDRDRRWMEQVIEKARASGKILEASAVEELLERVDMELSLLEREIDKLICFVGERSHISAADVKRLSAGNRTYTLWRIAEAMIWEKQPAPPGTDLHSLIAPLRWNLQVGLSLHTPGAPAPKMSPRRLEQRRSQAQYLGVRFFQHGLDTLFSLELLSRSTSISSDAALDFFQLKLVS